MWISIDWTESGRCDLSNRSVTGDLCCYKLRPEWISEAEGRSFTGLPDDSVGVIAGMTMDSLLCSPFIFWDVLFIRGPDGDKLAPLN